MSEERANVLRAMQVCRFCLSSDETLTSIYDQRKNKKQNVPLPLQLMACVAIEVFRNDGMPQLICNRCRNLTLQAYSFKSNCKKADDALKLFLATGSLSKPFSRTDFEYYLPQNGNQTRQAVRKSNKREEPSEKKIKIEQERPSSADSQDQNVNSGQNVEESILGLEEDHDSDYVENEAKGIKVSQVKTDCFACPYCERSFPLKQLLDIHKQNHNRERNFSCDECGRLFFTKYDLGKHLQTHTGDKPYSCVACNKQFARESLLHRHERTHNDVPKYLCSQCDRTFLNKEDLSTHLEKHKKKRPFTCGICSKSFVFKQNSRLPKSRRTIEALNFNETDPATQVLIKIVQAVLFPIDIHNLKTIKVIKPTSKLKSLNPFLDTDGIERVGGRLRNSNLKYNYKHPILLPSKHPFTRLLIEREHRANLHPGTQTTLSILRQNYWPLNGKSAVKSVIRSCLQCFKARSSTHFPQMGDLPESRITPSRTFSSCGVDYIGPFQIKDGKYRNRKYVKSYICLFICMSSKTVHLELVSELSTECFIGSLKRFVARRGLCPNIYSHNATNFTGANNELRFINKILQDSEFQYYLNKCRIQWHFIPARSPHFGVLREATVGSVKHHLKRVLTIVYLTFEEFYTLLSQVEAVLNSRPLSPMSYDPNDLCAITPGNFIIGEALVAVPEKNIRNDTINYISRFKHVQMMSQHLWTRWTQDYLHHLQQRTKWMFQKSSPISVGSLCILKGDNTPTLHWPLGRIIEVHPG